MFGFEGMISKFLMEFRNVKVNLAWWLSWLERRPVTAEVVGSNPIRVVRECLHSSRISKMVKPFYS